MAAEYFDNRHQCRRCTRYTVSQNVFIVCKTNVFGVNCTNVIKYIFLPSTKISVDSRQLKSKHSCHMSVVPSIVGTFYYGKYAFRKTNTDFEFFSILYLLQIEIIKNTCESWPIGHKFIYCNLILLSIEPS